MKVLFLECNMGAAGDMLMASLSELLPEPEKFVDDLRALNLPKVEISREYATSAGIRGARMHVFIRGRGRRMCWERRVLHGHDLSTTMSINMIPYLNDESASSKTYH